MLAKVLRPLGGIRPIVDGAVLAENRPHGDGWSSRRDLPALVVPQPQEQEKKKKRKKQRQTNAMMGSGSFSRSLILPEAVPERKPRDVVQVAVSSGDSSPKR